MISYLTSKQERWPLDDRYITRRRRYEQQVSISELQHEQETLHDLPSWYTEQKQYSEKSVCSKE